MVVSIQGHSFDPKPYTQHGELIMAIPMFGISGIQRHVVVLKHAGFYAVLTARSLGDYRSPIAVRVYDNATKAVVKAYFIANVDAMPFEIMRKNFTE
jgi:hypothetical protein